MSDDIKQMARSMLNKEQHMAHKTPQMAVTPKLQLPKHLVSHAHAYVSKILKAKGHPL